MALSAQSVPETLADHPLFTAHAAAWRPVLSQTRLKTYHHGDHAVHHGDAATHLWLVHSGWVKLARQTPDGKETIVGLCAEGDIFGEASLFAHANYPYHAEIVGQSAVLSAVPADLVRGLVASDRKVSDHVMRLLNERVSQAQLKLEHFSTMSAAQRLGCFLLRLCHMQMDGGKTLEIPVEKNILAAYLGMKPETFSRSQQQLKPLGIAVNGQRITVGDIARLRDFVCNSCSESGACDVEAAAE